MAMWTAPKKKTVSFSEEEAELLRQFLKFVRTLFKKGGISGMPKNNKTVAVVDKNGNPLMPTNNYRSRHLLKSGRARIYRYRPVFTIQILDREGGEVQPVEVKVDTGYQHIGLSVCSEKHEYLHRQYDLLTDEPERHRDCRQSRRQRRNRKRYRKPRFDNRKGKICQDGFAPSIRNKRDRHVDIIRKICEVFPVDDIYLESGNFDTQLLKALEEGKPAPQGVEYQQGERYGTETLREAVFTRDGYTCQCCGKSPFAKDKKNHAEFLRVHHIGFWKEDRSNRLSNLMTVCSKCHTSKNHQPGGKLFGLQPKLKPFKGATFMTQVRWDMLEKIKQACPDTNVHVTYGAFTKVQRTALGIPKSLANDAYAMGQFHPKHRAHTEVFRKQRRNNRVLEKFYDAKYVDIRTGEVKKAAALGCNRTNRSVPRKNPDNERAFRGEKRSNGHRSVRKQRYAIQPGTILKTPYGKQRTSGVHCQGSRAIIQVAGKPKSVAINQCSIVRYPAGWEKIS